MIHPHTEIRHASAATGLGLFAVRAIPKGTVTWVLDALDHRIAPEEVVRLPAERVAAFDHDYSRSWDEHHLLTHDNTLYMKHTCCPNCVHAAIDVEFAVRDMVVAM